MAKLDELLTQTQKRGASDLHLSAGEPVRMRIDGELKPVAEKPLQPETLSLLMREICREDQWRRYQETKELDFAYSVVGVSRFRCNYLVQQRGPGAVFRGIPEKITTLEQLELPPSVMRLPSFHSGLVLVTGPTGSGKSTTLAAVIHAINASETRHMITIEDPIEFVHQNLKSFIFQREVGLHAPTFARALEDSLLQDPNVILIGELRDLETISLAVTAAEMGVLVFATVHTNSAPKTIDRLVDVFPTAGKDQVRSMLASSLRAVLSQQLLKRKKGKGRVAAVEILFAGTGLSGLIRDGNTAGIGSYIESNKGQGMQSLDEHLQRLVEANAVDVGDAYLCSTDKIRFEQWMKKKGIELT